MMPSATRAWSGAAALLLAFAAGGAARGEAPAWGEGSRRPAPSGAPVHRPPPAVVAFAEVAPLFYDDLPHWDLGAGIALLGRPPGPQPILHVEAHLVAPGDVPPLRLEVGGGLYHAHRRNLIGGVEAAFTLGVRAGASPSPGAALRPWLGAEVDFGEGPVLIAFQLTAGVDRVAEGDLEGRALTPLGQGHALALGVGFRIGAPWPATPEQDPFR